jgi:hypothetical protein
VESWVDTGVRLARPAEAAEAAGVAEAAGAVGAAGDAHDGAHEWPMLGGSAGPHRMAGRRALAARR